MMRVHVSYEDAGSAAMLDRLMEALGDRTDLHEAMAEGAGELTRSHLMSRNDRSPNTAFYARASRSIETEASGEAGVVRIPQAGMALRFYGGRVSAGRTISTATGQPTKYQAIPTSHVPVRGGERMRPGEFPELAFLPARRGGGVSITGGYLVEGYRKEITRGSRRGNTRIAPLPGGRLMFVLRGFTDHEPDPSVIPSADDISDAARRAGEDYLTAISQNPTA